MPKLPSLQGLHEVRSRFKESLRRPPSEELVRIVEETLIELEKSKAEKNKPKTAAKNKNLPFEVET
jgi:hypothetical protein